MPPKASKETEHDENKMEAISILDKASEMIAEMLELKNIECRLDHENDIQLQLALDLVRKIRNETTQEKISAYAHIAESYLRKQQELDQADDKPFWEERNLICRLGAKLHDAKLCIKNL